MAGHGSAAPEDRADHPGRQVSRLTQAMAWQGILSSSEAAGAMADLRIGKPGPSYSGEAVQHYGGAQRLAADAFRNRNYMPEHAWRSNVMMGEDWGDEGGPATSRLRGVGHTPEAVQSPRGDNAEHGGRKVHIESPQAQAWNQPKGIRGGTARVPSPEKFE